MTSQDRASGLWHAVALLLTVVVAWEVIGLVGWWKFTKRTEWNECNPKERAYERP